MTTGNVVEKSAPVEVAPVKVAKVETIKPKLRVCTSCKGTGVFISDAGYHRGCFTCKVDYNANRGLGYITDEKAASNARREKAIQMGVQAVTYQVHEKKQGNNSYGWGCEEL